MKIPYQDLMLAAIEHRQMQFFLKDETLRQYKEFLGKSEEYKAQARAQAMVAAPLPPNSCPHDVSYKYDCAICDRENELALIEESGT